MPWARPFDGPRADRLLLVRVFRDTQGGFLAGDGLTAAAHQERGTRHFFCRKLFKVSLSSSEGPDVGAVQAATPDRALRRSYNVEPKGRGKGNFEKAFKPAAELPGLGECRA